MTSTILSIAIPTFNRADILNNNLLKMLPEIRKFSIPVFILDDSSDLETKRTVESLYSEYDGIFYSRNVPSLGHDANVLHALGVPDTDYVWLLGDSMYINAGLIEVVLNVIGSKRPGLIAVNASNRKISFATGSYTDSRDVFVKLAWHLTLTGATIYSRRASLQSKHLDKKTYTNFPQIALIFKFLASTPSFYWINVNGLAANSGKRSYWAGNMFEVFLDDWTHVIRSLPSFYDESQKNEVIMSHSRSAGIFGLKSLLLARSHGVFSLSVLLRHIEILPVHSGRGLGALLVICLTPKWVVTLFIRIFKALS